MNYSYLLLPAVQAKKLDVVKAAIGTAVFHQPKHDFINDADSRGITALALASLLWSQESDAETRQELDAIAAFLLDFKANPFQEVGVTLVRRYHAWTGRKEFERRSGKTIAELCCGKVPPSLKAHIRADAERVPVPGKRINEEQKEAA
ncbi:TPA: hypothetical protein ACOEOO_001851 [Stenotrophomonas maltophilia]|uniref:hypothetical protein n=1 Tax=Stenotrophomonas maltophilia group TaxID=995085 RepID=UPI001122E26A|nr:MULTISPECIES: hypothetical protein [Stenotrophomonas maltophilia group]MDH2038295.1 hypothetical protein [Stenotrophomonas maltophilia]MDT3488683.1 hypothetical protein [Stenotrophomonas maltophilia group sp. msm4]TNY01990.1 hypothetical protein FIU09_01905 [Stenotrophomonas maltophilia]TPD81651.1 hypothetical protein FJN21_00700 [Stenotrophomonas maltophilia]TPD83156.1 hypothetical protein FJN20_09505 [Stenotrophomonas maltophilia]